jgi:hypothetical protein
VPRLLRLKIVVSLYLVCLVCAVIDLSGHQTLLDRFRVRRGGDGRGVSDTFCVTTGGDCCRVLSVRSRFFTPRFGCVMLGMFGVHSGFDRGILAVGCWPYWDCMLVSFWNALSVF